MIDFAADDPAGPTSGQRDGVTGTSCMISARLLGTVFLSLGIACVGAADEQLSSGPVARALKLPTPPLNYAQVELPPHFSSVAQQFDNTPASNPITDDGATLGRVLFHDKTLSVNGTVSCASCHKQALGFSDDARRSSGFAGQLVSRNSMSLVNARYYPGGKFFWDERAPTLEAQVLMPIENPIEMGHHLDDLVRQLQLDPLYPPLFDKAFGTAEVTRDRISKALAQFVRSIVSYRSKYDAGRAKVESIDAPFPNFSEQENYGKQLFLTRARCAECHLATTPASAESNAVRQSAFFFVSRPTVNGIDADPDGADPGIGEHTGKQQDLGRFKVPSLRNVAVTEPYMHDGRLPTLDSVIEHYNWSVRPHPNLDPRLEDFLTGLGLPELEKVALAAFLETLTDQALLTDPKFSDPFAESGE